MTKVIYDTMFRNQELALKLNRPSCQDYRCIAVLGKMWYEVPSD